MKSHHFIGDPRKKKFCLFSSSVHSLLSLLFSFELSLLELFVPIDCTKYDLIITSISIIETKFFDQTGQNKKKIFLSPSKRTLFLRRQIQTKYLCNGTKGNKYKLRCGISTAKESEGRMSKKLKPNGFRLQFTAYPLNKDKKREKDLCRSEESEYQRSNVSFLSLLQHVRTASVWRFFK